MLAPHGPSLVADAMRRLVLIAAALLAMGAAPAAKSPAKKPAAKPAAAKPAAPKPAAEPGFDARDPQTLIAVLTAAGAKASAGPKVEDAVLLSVTSAAANFSVQFVGCNAQGRACQAALYDSGPAPYGPSLAQINGFNQSSAMCRAYQDKAGKPHVVYSTLMFPNMTRDQVMTQLAAWQGCLGSFAAFGKDPVAYLAEAP
jgi:hypothetical protein